MSETMTADVIPDAEAIEALKMGKSLRRRVNDSSSMGVSIRRHRTKGWIVEGFTDQPGPNSPVNVFEPFTLDPPMFKWPPAKWTQEDAIYAALQSYKSGAPF